MHKLKQFMANYKIIHVKMLLLEQSYFITRAESWQKGFTVNLHWENDEKKSTCNHWIFLNKQKLF